MKLKTASVEFPQNCAVLVHFCEVDKFNTKEAKLYLLYISLVVFSVSLLMWALPPTGHFIWLWTKLLTLSTIQETHRQTAHSANQICVGNYVSDRSRHTDGRCLGKQAVETSTERVWRFFLSASVKRHETKLGASSKIRTEGKYNNLSYTIKSTPLF